MKILILSTPTFCSLICVLPSIALAGSSQPNVDLSLGVSITPSEFTQNGRQTVSLTVYNAGPDVAGSIPGTSASIYVAEDAFYITDTISPPFNVVAPISGCYVDTFITEPLPDNRVAFLYIFNFDPIAAGSSRTCTYDIAYYPGTRNSFPSGWTVYTVNDTDTNPTNDYLPNVFTAAPASVPAMSNFVTATLIFVVWLLGAFNARRVRFRAIQLVAAHARRVALPT